MQMNTDAWLLTYDGDDQNILARKRATERARRKKEEDERRRQGEHAHREALARTQEQPFDEVQRDAIGGMISHERKQAAAANRELKAEIELLRNELGELRAELTIAKARRGEVVEARFLEQRRA